jgi:hypothetical protein
MLCRAGAESITCSAEKSHLVHCEEDIFTPLFQELGVERRRVFADRAGVEDQDVLQLSDHGVTSFREAVGNGHGEIQSN